MSTKSVIAFKISPLVCYRRATFFCYAFTDRSLRATIREMGEGKNICEMTRKGSRRKRKNKQEEVTGRFEEKQNFRVSI